MSGISCADCNSHLPDDIPGEQRIPCKNCGSIARSSLVSVTERLAVHDGYNVKIKRPSLPSDKKLRAHLYSDVEHSQKYNKLVRVHRTIDKDNDHYSEKVIDLQTGEILYECEEPLSQHRNRGTAKPSSGS